MLLPALVGWLNQRQQNAVAYLVEENRILRRHVRGRIRLTDDEPSAGGAWTPALGRRGLRVPTDLRKRLENVRLSGRRRVCQAQRL